MWQVQTDGSHLLPAATKLATPAGLAMGCMSLESPLIIPFKIAAYDLSTAAQNVVAELLQVCVAATAGGSAGGGVWAQLGAGCVRVLLPAHAPFVVATE